jgi:hypothetical protein
MSIRAAESQPKGRILGALWSMAPVEARLVQVLVGQTDWEWCQPFIGTMRRAIEVKLPTLTGHRTVFVDNYDGRALQVFLMGRAPLPGFRLLPAFAVYEDDTAESFYQAKLN